MAVLTLLQLAFGFKRQDGQTLGINGSTRVEIGLDLEVVAREVHHYASNQKQINL